MSTNSNKTAVLSETKEELTAKIIKANFELGFQNGEKQKRADELAVANKELLFQNEEKQKRSDELAVANKELIFQNEEKQKRADELAIANKELLFQNEEKQKRAEELVVANIELLFQNEEKQKRALELAFANREIAFQNMASAELATANEALESFSYSISHDLRAPLRAINGYTKILIEDYQKDLTQEALNFLNEISINSQKMSELIDNLLEFSRLGKMQVTMNQVDVKQLVDAIVADHRQQVPNRDISISVQQLNPIKGDRNMLRQVFENLISNAIKYTGYKKEAIIEVGGFSENNECVYYVKDNGAGFDMQYSDKLFGVFQRLHSSSEFDGTGVGLAIVHKIIEKHGGKVWAEGKVNEGACFYFSLPIL